MSLRYAYGIAPVTSAAAIEAAGLTGIDGATVRAIVEGALAAVTSDLDEATWSMESLNERVRDLEWLTPRAEAHQSVNARALDVAGTLLPLSFGALYRDDERVREMLREDAAARAARLLALTGRGEWVVTITRGADDVPSADAELAALDREIAASDPGRGYLLRKRRGTVALAAAERADADAAQRAIDALAAVAERTYREPVARGGPEVVALRVSVLADRRDGAVPATISGLSDELGRAGYRVLATGPWPAYRFGALA